MSSRIGTILCSLKLNTTQTTNWQDSRVHKLWRCITTPSLVTKDWAVEKISAKTNIMWNFGTFAVTLALYVTTQYFHSTFWSLFDKTNIQWSFEPLLWPWTETQWPIFSQDSPPYDDSPPYQSLIAAKEYLIQTIDQETMSGRKKIISSENTVETVKFWLYYKPSTLSLNIENY